MLDRRTFVTSAPLVAASLGLVAAGVMGTAQALFGSASLAFADDSYIIPGSDVREITAADVAGKSAWELKLARNEIYARHGYIFQDKDLSQYFSSKSWYKPLYDLNNFDEKVLSYTEQKNIGFIAKYEQGGAVSPTDKSGDYVIPGSDTRLLNENDLRGFSSYCLYLARNEIYARHGYIFSNQDLKDYFSTKSWYKPLYNGSTFDNNLLSSIENQNIQFILKHENGQAGDLSNQFIFPYSHLQYLGDADLRGKSAWELKLARNEIYARHGYIFQSEDLRKYFSEKSWYVPVADANSFDEGAITLIEWTNIARIMAYEKLAGNPCGSVGPISDIKPAGGVTPEPSSPTPQPAGNPSSFTRDDGREVYITWQDATTFKFTTNSNNTIYGNFVNGGVQLYAYYQGNKVFVYQATANDPSGWFFMDAGTQRFI